KVRLDLNKQLRSFHFLPFYTSVYLIILEKLRIFCDKCPDIICNLVIYAIIVLLDRLILLT
ncbi:MAG: hypothetical protein JSU79_07965, partial [Dehalococcoidales bacterium]